MFKQLLVGILASVCMSASMATPMIDPINGLYGTIGWHAGPGKDLHVPVDFLFDEPGSTFIGYTPEDTRLFITISDTNVFGNAFAVEMDGVLLEPTSGLLGPDSRGPDATNYFIANYENILLTAGWHTFEIFVTDAGIWGEGIANGFVLGYVPFPTDVPEPGSLALLGLGLLGGGLIRRKRSA